LDFPLRLGSASPSAGRSSLLLPPWTNRIDVWPEESRDSIQLAGDFSVGRGAFRGIAISSARSYFSYTNRTWNVSGLQVNAAGGALDLDYAWNELAHAYHFNLTANWIRPSQCRYLTPQQQRTLGQMSFPERPEIQGDVWAIGAIRPRLVLPRRWPPAISLCGERL